MNSNLEINNILKEFNFSNQKQAINKLRDQVVSYIKINDFKSANYLVDKLLIVNPDNFEVYRDKAYISYSMSDFITSEKFIKKALVINKEDVFGLNIYALTQMKKKNYTNAILALQSAINIDDKYIDSFNNLGTCFFEIEKITEAFANFKKAYKLDMKNSNTLINIGNILSLNDKYKQAINSFKKVLNVMPDNINVLTNIAICYCRQKDIVNAEKIFRKLKKLSSNSHELNYIFSTTLINLGYFEKAWPLFESRLHLKNRHKHIKNYELLKNMKFNNEIDFKVEKILILREQGIGEEILFSSLYKKIIGTNDNIKIETDKRLVPAFNRSFGKNIFYEEGYFSNEIKRLEKFDKILYAGSLCQFFLKNKKNFSEGKYLLADDKLRKKFKKNFLKHDKIKVGLSWKSKVSIYGSLKSLQLKDFKPLFTKNRVLFSLQYGDVKKERNLFNKNELIFFDDVDLFNDLESLMAILSNLDVFVTVSNSTAHISAALGIKTIVICPKKSSTYFYWNSINKKSFWYKSVKVLSLEGSISKTMEKIDKII